MMKYLQAITLSCLLITMIGCTRARDKPQLNPHPKHFLTIKGYIAPELKGKVYLAFVQTYSASNKKTLITTNWLAGAQGYPMRKVVFIPKGKYVVKIPLDKYLFGKGGWIPRALDLNLSTSADKLQIGDGGSFVRYSKHTQPIPKYYNLICHGQPNDCEIEIPDGFYTILILNPNKSHTINFNLLYRK